MCKKIVGKNGLIEIVLVVDENDSDYKTIPSFLIEDISEMICENIDVQESYSKGYPATYMEPGEPDSVETTVYSTLTFKKIGEKYNLTDEVKEAIIDAIYNDYFEEEIEKIKEYVKDSFTTPSFTPTSVSCSLKVSKDKESIYLDYEVEDYDFDRYEYEDSMREMFAPDPYDDF